MYPLVFVVRTIACTQLLIGCVGLVAVASSPSDLFPDKQLEAVVRKEVFEKRYNSDPLSADDVKNISQVVGKGKEIKSLEGLQHCKALMKIDFENNEISDLAPIQNLKLLQSIDLSSNRIESIAPLEGLIQTQYLQLSKNKISDLRPLKEMANLRSVYLSDNQIKSLEPLVGLKKAWSLFVARNPIEDASPIGLMKGVDSISLEGCRVQDLAFVKDLKLRTLILDGNPISNFGPLVEAVEADAKTDRRYAPFLRLYVSDTTLKDSAHQASLERIRATGARVNPGKK
jgi:internalin A